MNVDRNVRLPDLIFVYPFAFKKDIGLKLFFAKRVSFWNYLTLRMGVALEILVAAPRRSDFDIVCKTKNGT